MFLLVEPSFCHCCKVGWKLVAGVCEHMNYWKRVFSSSFDVMNPNIKSFLLLIEWKIFLLVEPSFCHCCTVGWFSFWCMRVYELMKESVFQLFWCAESIYQIILLLVEWKIFIHKIICGFFVSWTIILSLL